MDAMSNNSITYTVFWDPFPSTTPHGQPYELELTAHESKETCCALCTCMKANPLGHTTCLSFFCSVFVFINLYHPHLMHVFGI